MSNKKVFHSSKNKAGKNVKADKEISQSNGEDSHLSKYSASNTLLSRSAETRKVLEYEICLEKIWNAACYRDKNLEECST